MIEQADDQDAGPSRSLSPRQQPLPPPPQQSNISPIQHQNFNKRKLKIELSSLPLQILLHLNVYFFLFYWLCELLLYIYKGVRFPFPGNFGGTLVLEMALLLFIAVIEGFRLFFGYKGNLAERKQTLVWSVILSLPILISQLYLMLWQTYVLRVEIVLCAIFFIMVSLEVLLSAATIWTFHSFCRSS